MKQSTVKSLTLAVLTAISAYTGQSLASSHAEAPNITRMPKVDATDYYLFNSYESGRNNYVTMIANYIPLQKSIAGPNYYSMDPTAYYDLHIDNNADAMSDITFRFEFDQSLGNLTIPVTDENGQSVVRTIPLKAIGPISSVGNNGAVNANSQNFFENYTLKIITNDKTINVTNSTDGSKKFNKPLDFMGEQTFGSAENYEQYAKQAIYEFTTEHCSQPAKVFVGPRQESFSVDLGNVFDLINLVPVPTGVLTQFPGGDPGITNDPAKNTIKDFNVTSIAIEYPTECLINGDSIIGGWTSSSLPTTRTLNSTVSFNNTETVGTGYTQVSRLGSPLINELVIGIESKDRFNKSKPVDDADATTGFASEVTNPAFPYIVNALFLNAVNSGLGLSGDQQLSSIAPNNAGRGDLVTTFLTGIPGFTKPSNGPNTLSEMIRLNTSIAALPAELQDPDGALARDENGQFAPDGAGYPNGRRPGDDVVDITLRIAMGALCADDIQSLLPTISPNQQSDFTCSSSNAPVAAVEFLDGAPVKSTDFQQQFPYLNTPLKGNR